MTMLIPACLRRSCRARATRLAEQDEPMCREDAIT